MAIINLLIRNLMILYIGAILRYGLNCIFKTGKSFQTILHGVEVKTKEDEILNINNEIINRIYGITGLIIIVIIIAVR